MWDDCRQLEAGSLVPRDLVEPFFGFGCGRLYGVIRAQNDDAGDITPLVARRSFEQEGEAKAVPDMLADVCDEVFLGVREVGLTLLAGDAESPPGCLAGAEGRAQLVRNTEVGVDRPVPDAPAEVSVGRIAQGDDRAREPRHVGQLGEVRRQELVIDIAEVDFSRALA